MPAQSSRSVQDGVYTEEQAKRGQALYSQQCAECHGADLNGQDEAPPLTGTFFDNWKGLTVDQLLDRIRTTMPANKPGTLSRQRAADIISWILQFNKLPAGTMELSSQAEVLKEIRIDAPKP